MRAGCPQRRYVLGHCENWLTQRPQLENADVRFFDTGHFALETHCDEIAVAIRNFLSRSK
jgi:hypothetical protein